MPAEVGTTGGGGDPFGAAPALEHGPYVVVFGTVGAECRTEHEVAVSVDPDVPCLVEPVAAEHARGHDNVLRIHAFGFAAGSAFLACRAFYSPVMS